MQAASSTDVKPNTTSTSGAGKTSLAKAVLNRTRQNPVQGVQTETMDHHGTPIAKAQSDFRKEFEKCSP
jgi:hypothetical protein